MAILMSLLMKTKNRKLYTITGTCNGCHILIIIEVHNKI